MKDHDQEIRRNQRKKTIRKIIVGKRVETEDLNPKIDTRRKMMETRANTKRKRKKDKEMKKRNKKTQKEPNR